MNIKKNCNNCKALNITTGICNLNYKLKVIYGNGVTTGLILECKPLELCPKPRTIKEYVNCKLKD
jgi:hypothetical protein